MTKISTQITDLDQNLAAQVPAIVLLKKVDAPYTTVVKRAQCTDFSQDLMPRFGVERIQVQDIQEVQGETGPNGERVFKPINDQYDAVRLVGAWGSSNNANGSHVQHGAAGTDYIEITFYGTGLNILAANFDGSRDARATVDGGAEGANFMPAGVAVGLQGRNYPINSPINAVSGLTLGLHTVKIRAVTWLRITGYEVLNTNSTLQYTKGTSYSGGKRLYVSALTTAAYNSGFESGTLGTRGGCVLVYQKSSGVVAKAVTPTNTSAAYLTSADHTNEEVVRTYHWREFGAGRTDDFSSLINSGGTNRAFTLDDGTTTLVSLDCVANTNEGLHLNTANSSYVKFTFVGTGLDIAWTSSGAGTNASATAHEVYIDGVAQGGWDTVGNTNKTIKKVVSGLPYGTHTVSVFRNTTSSWTLQLHQFIVYAPKTPTLPSGAVALGQYYLMADFAANTTVNGLYLGSGIQRKNASREWVYTGTWSVLSISPSSTSATRVQTTATSSAASYTFWGSGFDIRFNGLATYSVSVLNILTNTTITNFSGYTVSVYGNSFTAASGTGTASSSDGSGLNISGLGLGLYKVTITATNTSGLNVDTIDIITPVHAPVFNGPGVLQNTLAVGSCAIADKRKFSEQQVPTVKAWAQAIGVTSTPTTTASTTAPAPMPDMSLTLKTSGNPVLISYSAAIRNNTTAGNVVALQIYVDGVAVGQQKSWDMSTAGYTTVSSDSILIQACAGSHKVDVYWGTSAGTAASVSTSRNLTVQEL